MNPNIIDHNKKNWNAMELYENETSGFALTYQIKVNLLKLKKSTASPISCVAPCTIFCT